MSLKKVFGVAAVTLSSFLVVRLMACRDSFAGKVIVITGGSRGLGLALARRLARAQAKLAILARDEQELVRAKSDLAHYGSIVTTWVCDVRNESAVRSTVEEIASALGGIDVLINNAGEIVVGPLDAAGWERGRDPPSPAKAVLKGVHRQDCRRRGPPFTALSRKLVFHVFAALADNVERAIMQSHGTEVAV